MQKATISIVYHSNYGHTEQAALLLSGFLETDFTKVLLINVEEAENRWADLHSSDTILFGCPTYFGNVSARFKTFMESTGSFWYSQAWKNKFAGAFTVSATTGGDKLNTLQSLAIFAAQHSMHWISLGVLPRYCNNMQTEGQNRLGTYLGLTLQSDNSQSEVHPFHPGDLLTIELFANRVLDVTLGFRNLPIPGNAEVKIKQQDALSSKE